VVDACSFLGMAAAATALPAAGGGLTNRATRATVADLVHGYRALRVSRGVLTLTLTALGVLAIDGALQVFRPAYSRTTLGSGPATYGLLISATGVGSLAGTLLFTSVVGRLQPSRSLPLAVAGSGLCVALLAAVHTVVTAVGLAVLVGVLAAPFYPIARAVLQRLVPEHERGRVFGARASITTCGFPTGAALGGLLLTSTSAPVTAIIIAVAHAPIVLGLLVFPSRPEGHQESATESCLEATCGREGEGEELPTIGGQQVDHLLA
jgi:MFS family permease